MRICLVNMPFGDARMPSLALTQLQGVLATRFGGRVQVEIHYFNQDFAKHIGVARYQRIAYRTNNSALGDWLFRPAAFPQEEDNQRAYLNRFYPLPKAQEALQSLLELRGGFSDFLDRLLERHALDRATIVGCSSMFSQNLASFALLRKVKERNPDVVTVMGGANCESPMGEGIVREMACIDAVFSGPALRSFPQFVENLLEGCPEKSTALNGVFTRAAESAPAGPPAVKPRGDELDINAEVPLDYEPFLRSFGDHFENEALAPRLLFETSRGCWWGEHSHCTFCGLNSQSMGYRSMTADRALATIRQMLEYSPRCSSFFCVDNILDKSYLADVFPKVDAPPDVAILMEVKADLSEADLRTLSRAGVRAIQPGIEALSTKSLKLMRKGVSAIQNVALLRNCAMTNVFPFWAILVGSPGETADIYEKYCRDLPRVVHLPPPGGVEVIRFDRYSVYHMRPQEFGLELEPFPYYEMVYPFPKDTLHQIAYFFDDRNRIQADYFAELVKSLGRMQELARTWQQQWYEPKREPPRLFFERRNGSSTVYDSRSGDVVRHEVGALGTQILTRLEAPMRLGALEVDAKGVGTAEVEDEVGRLSERGLIFEEDGRAMSLVFPTEPPPWRPCALAFD